MLELARGTSDPTISAGAIGAAFVGGLLGYLIAAFALMGVFKKAGEPAWAAVVPFYNSYVLTRVAGDNP